MKLSTPKTCYYKKTITGFPSVNHYFLWLMMINIAGYLVEGNKDIPICHKLWNRLGNDMADWRKQCLDGDDEINSAACQAQKEYFEETRLTHREMCFYEGKIVKLLKKYYQFTFSACASRSLSCII